MIRTIAKREFLSNLMSYKFAIGMALCLILLPLGTYVSTRNYQRRLERYELDRDAHQRELTKLHVYSALHPQVDKRPPVLSIIAEGLEERLKSSMRAGRHQVPCLEGKGGRMALSRNRYPQAFPNLEIVWLLAIILSLVAVLFAHDTVTGDRELGTLRLTLSNSVPRHQVLLGKYLGGIGSLFIPLLTGFLAALVVMNLSAVSLSTPDWLAILIIFLLSSIYLSAFFLLGMTVSSLTRRSSTSLIILLAVWVALTELLPHASIFAAKNIISVASMEKVRAEKKAIEEQKNKEEGKIWQTVRQRMPKGGFQILVNKKDSNEKGQLLRFMSPETAEFLKEVFGGEIERVEVKYADKMAWQDQSYVRQLERQWWLADILSAPSLARPFSSTVRALAGTDVEAFKSFVEKARQYRQEILAFLEAQVRSNPYRFFTDDPVGEIQKDWPRAVREERISRAELGEKMKAADSDPRRLLDLTSMPRFSPPEEGVLERLSRRWRDLTVLLISNVGLFMLAFSLFLRYDPR